VNEIDKAEDIWKQGLDGESGIPAANCSSYARASSGASTSPCSWPPTASRTPHDQQKKSVTRNRNAFSDSAAKPFCTEAKALELMTDSSQELMSIAQGHANLKTAGGQIVRETA
jgi:hypothetical protein